MECPVESQASPTSRLFLSTEDVARKPPISSILNFSYLSFYQFFNSYYLSCLALSKPPNLHSPDLLQHVPDDLSFQVIQWDASFFSSSSLNRIELNCTPVFPQVAAPPQKPCDDAYCIITIESSLRVFERLYCLSVLLRDEWMDR